MMQTVIACVITAVVALIIGIPIGIQIRKRTAEKEINSAEEEAKRIINESIKSAESKKREALVEAKEEILQARNEYEREVKERRADLQKQERRLQQKEENLDRKTENIEKKEDTLQRKLAELDEARDEVATVKKTQMEVLERISGFTAEEAKNYLINQLAEEVTHESAMKVREIEAQFKEEADTRAKEILSLAIQRCAADHVAEATVSVVPLPNDEMKGRIIGREGRNIRTLETMTGVDLIIDDTPEAITVSCFDPVRREIARIALEKLIQDGRIHPTRIEEMVEKAKREVDATIKAEGERAVFETNVHGLHPELIKLLGRMRYRTSYGQNVLNHSIEVSHLAGLIAAEIGADVTQAKRAGLLHDLGKSIDHEVEGSHVQIGVELARKYRENEDIVHAIEAHHNDVEPRTIVACIVQAADAISAARPGARRENLENYIKRLEKLEEVTSSFPGVEKSFAIQAGRELRVIVGADKLSDDVRWKSGTPPNGNANFAWIQHIIHHLAPTGRAGVVLANGSLSSQSGGEGDIRRRLIEADLVDCIVAMPPQLFYTTQIPVSIWFFNKAKTQPGHTLFIDARNLGTMVTRKLRELTDCEPEEPARRGDIQRIADTYWAYAEGRLEAEQGFCAVATTAEIAAQEFILTPGRYVGIAAQAEDSEPFAAKMERLTGELSALFAQSHTLEAEIRRQLESIGYKLED